MNGRPGRGTPASQGFRMPAEWEPHAATWIAWPHEARDWPGKLPAIRRVYADIVRVLSESERVEIVVQDAAQERAVVRALRSRGADLPRVRTHRWSTDRSWVRDSGPTFLRRPPRGNAPGAVGIVRWKFNAWARYDNYQRDRRLPPRIARALGFPIWKATAAGRWVVLEGGAFDVDGQGLLMTTEECLLSDVQVRNPGLGRSAIERVFRDYLGATSVVWLNRGIEGDDTHGHVDDAARFVAPATVLAVLPDDPASVDRSALEENLERLRAFRTAGGRRLRIRTLPAPHPVTFRGQHLPASYANFYIANHAVLVPTFHDPHDAEALGVLARAFPDREVVGIPSRDLVWGLGTLHCLTQPQPLP